MNLDIARLLLIFGAGSLVGSFLNVVILRRETLQGVLWGRSHCPHCQRTLAWYELVPILSFIGLRGRCHSCKKPISWQYPLVELTSAMLAVILFASFPLNVMAWQQALLMYGISLILLILFVIDVSTFTLPDTYLVMLGVLTVLYQWVTPTSALPPWGIIVGSGFLLLLWIITRGQGIGFGDVKLMIPLGLLFGLSGVITLLFAAFMTGGLYAIILLLLNRAHMKTAVPFGPFLIGAAYALVVWPELPQVFMQALIG